VTGPLCGSHLPDCLSQSGLGILEYCLICTMTWREEAGPTGRLVRAAGTQEPWAKELHLSKRMHEHQTNRGISHSRARDIPVADDRNHECRRDHSRNGQYTKSLGNYTKRTTLFKKGRIHCSLVSLLSLLFPSTVVLLLHNCRYVFILILF